MNIYMPYDEKFDKKEESRGKQGTEVVFYGLWFERSSLIKRDLEGDLNAVRSKHCLLLALNLLLGILNRSSVKLNCKLIRRQINKDDILGRVDVILNFSLGLLDNNQIYSQT